MNGKYTKRGITTDVPPGTESVTSGLASNAIGRLNLMVESSALSARTPVKTAGFC